MSKHILRTFHNINMNAINVNAAYFNVECIYYQCIHAAFISCFIVKSIKDVIRP